MSNDGAHGKYLDELVDHGLADIGLQGRDIEMIFCEPVWYGYDSWEKSSMCDLIVLMQDKIAYPLELKGSNTKRNKAIDQLYHGKMLIDYKFPEYDSSTGLFVIYTRARYIREDVPLCSHRKV